jgi:prefoldin subunit 5
MTHDEAHHFIKKKEQQLNQYAQELTQKAGYIRAHIRWVLETLYHVTQLQNPSSSYDLSRS